MKQIVIIGCSGHAAELRDYINHFNTNNKTEQIQVVGFVDDDENGYEHYGYKEPLLGNIKDHQVRLDCYYLMAIANLAYRQRIVEEFQKKGAKFTGLIHPTAIISPSAEIGEGTVISHNASVGPKVKIGKFNMLNSRCTIGHDTLMGDFNIISPQTAISGNTKIGHANLFGTNSCSIPSVKIGNNNKIGAGMVVFKDIGDNETVIFRFTEKLIIKDDSNPVD